MKKHKSFIILFFVFLFSSFGFDLFLSFIIKKDNNLTTKVILESDYLNLKREYESLLEKVNIENTLEGEYVVSKVILHDPYVFFDTITILTIPSCIESIEEYAFQGMISVEEVRFGNNIDLTQIPDGAFSSCTSLTSIVIPKTVEYIGDGAFENCESLENIVIPASVKTIGPYAFSVNALTSVTFEQGSNLERIEEGAFSFNSLTDITIPDSVSYIGTRAFVGNGNLTTITFENTNGWTAGSTSLTSSNLSNSATAATYLTNTYANREWTRS